MIGDLQVNEMMTLLTGVVLGPFVLLSTRQLHNRLRAYILATYIAMFVSVASTNLEALVLPEVFSLLEHLMLTVASILFLCAVVSVRRHGLEGRI